MSGTKKPTVEDLLAQKPPSNGVSHVTVIGGQVNNVQNRSGQLPDSAVAEGTEPSLLSQQGSRENVPPTDNFPSGPSVGSQSKIDVPDDGDVRPLSDPTVAEESGRLLLTGEHLQSGGVLNGDQGSDDVHDTGQLPLTDPMVVEETSDHCDRDEIEFIALPFPDDHAEEFSALYIRDDHPSLEPCSEIISHGSHQMVVPQNFPLPPDC